MTQLCYYHSEIIIISRALTCLRCVNETERQKYIVAPITFQPYIRWIRSSAWIYNKNHTTHVLDEARGSKREREGCDISEYILKSDNAT